MKKIKKYLIKLLLGKDYNIISSEEYNRYMSWKFIIDNIEPYIEWNNYKFISFFTRKVEWVTSIFSLMAYKWDGIDNACKAQNMMYEKLKTSLNISLTK